VKRALKYARLQDIGCLACRMDGRGNVPSDMHHPLRGYRIGKDVVVPLCVWHHRGVCVGNPDVYAERWGPSLHHHGKKFRAKYGTDAELLAQAETILAALP
jgi:hypothetical protein